MDCIWVNLKNVGPPFFKFISVYVKMSTAGKSFSVVMWRDYKNEKLLLCQFDV